MSQVTYQCKQCSSTDLSVTVTVSAKLIQNGLFVETDAEGSDHEWDDHSMMCCNECGIVLTVVEFLVEDE